MPEPAQSEEAIFLAASQLATAQERDAYLRGACGDDEELRQRLDRLLAAHDASRGPLDLSPPGLNFPATVDQPALEKPGARIGPYKLLQQIGEGGMGVVFMAEQTEPVQRKVALKLIKPGMDTRQVVARFEAERQALALMDHVNIARVLDAGATEAGRPYFVMELVHGVPITRYCDDNRLTPRQRLELFVPVCQAIQHAHQKGIIHRDIKPSNVMITLYDGKPVPKIIDFGVAKATEQRLTERTLFTQYGTMIGTFEYMSPEQAEMSGLGVDTRSDIYSLGVLLYELLTGSTPLTSRRIREAAYDEVLRMIREEEPPKPSTRLSESGDALASISARRHTDPGKLTSQVRGELDWIVMKCLEKDRNRRYESANGFAADVQRYLADEPVLACPPSDWYRFRKFARRNKAKLTVVAAAGLATIAVIAGLIASNLAISRQKEEKQIAFDRLEIEKLRADENLERARQAVDTFLHTASNSAALNSGDFQDVRRRLLESALPFYREFAEQSHDDPDLELQRGKAIESMGFLQREIGDLEQAVQAFATAEDVYRQLADTHPDRTEFLCRLAAATTGRAENLADLQKVDDAERAHRQAMELLERLVALPGANDELRITHGRNCNSLGVLLYETNRLAEAESVLRRAIQVREQVRDSAIDSKEARGNLAQSTLNLGLVLRGQGRLDDAILQYQLAAKLFAELPPAGAPPDRRPDPRALKGRSSALNNLGVVYREAGRMEEAAAASHEAVAIKQTLAEAFPSVPLYQLELARGYSNLGVLYSFDPNGGQAAEAQTAYEKSIAVYERLAAGSTDRAQQAAIELAGTCSNLGRLLGDGGRLEESLPWLTKAVEQLEAAFKREPRLAKVRDSLVIACWTRAMTLAGLRRFEESLGDWSRAIELDEGPYDNQLRVFRASTLLNMLDHARAGLDAEAVTQSSQATAKLLVQAASIFALSAQLVPDDAGLAESYAARGVNALRLSASKERPDLQAWRESGDLRALHSRDDFKRLIEELSAQAPPGEPAAQPAP